ncbi:MAG: response regulator, partial [Ruminiclostridium sp.]
MYKLLIVDDEYLIRKSLTECIDWLSFGIEVMEANSGEKALKKIKEENLDILITDIRMPVLSGLELIKTLQRSGLHIKVIIISGYDDFGYAQEAIQLGAIGYILKPIDNSDVIEMVNKAITLIEAEKSKNKRIEELEQQLVQSMPVFRDKFLNDLIRGKNYPIEDLKEKLSFFKIELQEDKYITVMIIEIDNYLEYLNELSERERQFKKLILSNKINELLKGILFECQDNQFVLIFQNDAVYENKESIEKDLKSISVYIAQRIQSVIGEELKFDIS